jgi:phosphoglycolate phosphatase
MQDASPRAPWPRAALFDLDGTLIDSVPDITEAVAELLAAEGFERFSAAEVRGFVGHGVPRLVQRAFGARGITLEGEALAGMVERMMTIYPRHLVARSVLMPGVAAALDFLAEAEAQLAVVSNKPQQAAEDVLAHFGILDRFALVLGDRPTAGTAALARKPAPDMLLYVLDQLGAETAEAVMVGDSGPDMQSAKAAHVFAVGVRGGYSTAPLESFEPDLVLDSLADLPRALTARRRAQQR